MRSLESVAAALLRLDADAVDAARALMALMDHPCERNRTGAMWQAAEALGHQPFLSTESALLIERSLATRFQADPSSVPVSCLPLLLQRHREEVVQYCDRLLGEADPRTRRDVLQALVTSGDWWCAMHAMRALVRWAREASDLDTVLLCVDHLGSLVPLDVVEQLAREGLADESPGVRKRVNPLLKHVPAARARRLARAALRDEPDPALRRKLETYAGWLPPRRPAPKRRARGGAARERLR